jgi:hypothetical protein
MKRFVFAIPRGPFRSGLGMGLLCGSGLLLGVLLMLGLTPWAGLETPVEAVATSGGDTMAIATGPIGDGVEGLFILDFVTSHLTCQVLNPRTGQLSFLYQRNVAQDLGVQQGKQPKYMLITGLFNVRQQVSNVKPAECLVYVADINTGRYIVYMMPYSKAAMELRVAVATQMIPVGGGSARNVAVEQVK